MFPVLVTIKNPEDLKRVYALLSEGADAPAAQTATPVAADPPKPAKAKAAKAADTAPAATPAAAAVVTLTSEGQAFFKDRLTAPVMELSMKNEPKMKAILAEYGVERASLVPEKLFPELLEKVTTALDPGAAERKRLEAIDKTRSSNLL